MQIYSLSIKCLVKQTWKSIGQKVWESWLMLASYRMWRLVSQMCLADCEHAWIIEVDAIFRLMQQKMSLWRIETAGDTKAQYFNI